MRIKIFSVFDVKAGAYMTPFFSTTAGMAMRSFQDAVSDQSHQFHKHAADYTLFQIGEYDDEKGSLKSTEHVNLGSALEVLAQVQEKAHG